MDQWIAKAEAALRTGQPRLAELYMRRGLSESWLGRAWLFGWDLGLWPNLGVRRDYALAGPSKGVAHGNAV